MIILPYRVEAGGKQFPVLTALVVVACFSIYIVQSSNTKKLDAALKSFCVHEVKLHKYMFAGKELSDREITCRNILQDLYYAHDKENALQTIMGQIKKQTSNNNVIEAFSHYLKYKYTEFATLAPKQDISAKLWLVAGTFDPVRMLTAVFAHGSWLHVLTNIFFFIVFASVVERVIGWKGFVGLFILIAYGSHAIYSLLYNLGPEQRQEVTIGLSGVVVGMMAFTVVILPHAKMICIFWVIIYLTTVSLPAWIWVLSYVSLDLIRYAFSSDQNTVNFIVHLAGAAVGALAALMIPLAWRRRIALRSALPGLKGKYAVIKYKGSDSSDA